MNKVVREYTLPFPWRNDLPLPKGAEVLGVVENNGTVCLYAEVVPEITTENRCFFVVGTGEVFNKEDKEYIGAVMVGAYVWHVYEET